MESELHKKLKYRARNYLWDKSYFTVRVEVPCLAYGIYDVWGIKSDLNCMGIEVKVSKADFRNNKWKEAKLKNGIENNLDGYIPANENYILCPEGLIKPEEIDENYGLLWFNGERLVNKKKPKFIKITSKAKLMIAIELLDGALRGLNKP